MGWWDVPGLGMSSIAVCNHCQNRNVQSQYYKYRCFSFFRVNGQEVYPVSCMYEQEECEAGDK